MSLIAEALKHMLAAGMDHDAIVAAVAAMDDARAIGKDPVAEKRRAWDRERKRNSGGTPVEPVESSETGGMPPLPLALPPQTPLSHTPTPPDVTTRARGGSSKPNGFARFWEAYPNKIAKAKAETAYARALAKIPGHDPPAVILAGVERAKASRAWADGYIPHPTTWLNGGCWEDEPAEVIPINGRSHERPHHDAKFDARQANSARADAGAFAAARQRFQP